MKSKEENPIVHLSFNFALKIVDFCTQLDPLQYIDLRRQVFKAGTSIGANVWEAQNAESRKDFIHKMKVGAKEGDETEYWLLLCQESPHLPSPGELLQELSPITKVLNKIIGTSKKTDVQELKDR